MRATDWPTNSDESWRRHSWNKSGRTHLQRRCHSPPQLMPMYIICTHYRLITGWYLYAFYLTSPFTPFNISPCGATFLKRRTLKMAPLGATIKRISWAVLQNTLTSLRCQLLCPGCTWYKISCSFTETHLIVAIPLYHGCHNLRKRFRQNLLFSARLFNNLVDDTVIFSFLGAHPVVAVHVLLYLLDVLARILGEYLR